MLIILSRPLIFTRPGSYIVARIQTSTIWLNHNKRDSFFGLYAISALSVSRDPINTSLSANSVKRWYKEEKEHPPIVMKVNVIYPSLPDTLSVPFCDPPLVCPHLSATV